MTKEKKYKKFGNFEVSPSGMINFYVGWCSLEEEDIQNFLKALKESKNRRKKK